MYKPPRQSSWKVRVVNPAAQQVEKVNGDCEIQALLSSPNEIQQAYGTVKGRGEKILPETVAFNKEEIQQQKVFRHFYIYPALSSTRVILES